MTYELTATRVLARGDRYFGENDEEWQVLSVHPSRFVGRHKREVAVTLNNTRTGQTLLLTHSELRDEGFTRVDDDQRSQ